MNKSFEISSSDSESASSPMKRKKRYKKSGTNLSPHLKSKLTRKFTSIKPNQRRSSKSFGR